MKGHPINFSFIAFSLVLFFVSLSIYQVHCNTTENGAKNYSVNDRDKIALSDDISLAVNKINASENPVKKEVNEPKSASAFCPGDILNLTNWKHTAPEGKSEKPTETFQPELNTLSVDSCFYVAPTEDGVVFRAPVNGVTTKNSSYPRSELREMKNGGEDQASWSTTDGTHTMFIDQAITAVPNDKKHIVAGQIHGSEDDIIAIRLEHPKLFIDLNGEDGPILDANYKLGTRFTVKFVAEDGKIKIYYNDGEEPAYTYKKKDSSCYFKAGVYTQSNCSKEKKCSDDNFGEVVIYNLTINHQ